MMLVHRLKAIRLALPHLVRHCALNEIEDRDAKASLPPAYSKNLDGFVAFVCKKYDTELVAVVSYLLGETAAHWKHDPFLVFHHMNMVTDKDFAQCVYLLILGTFGTGYGLRDEYDAALDKAGEVLGFDNPIKFDDSPVTTESTYLLNVFDSEFVYEAQVETS